MRKISVLVLLALPIVSNAQTLQVLTKNVGAFLMSVIVPFLLGISFLIFVYNAVRFFVFEGSNEDGREKAKALAIYSVSSFVIIIIFAGIVNMLVDGIGLGGKEQPKSDYIEEMNR